MPKIFRPLIGYTTEFTVATNKVVHATDNNANPRKFTSSGSLSEDELVVLSVEAARKAAAAFKAGNRTFLLLIDDLGGIFPDPAFPAGSLDSSLMVVESVSDAAQAAKPAKPKKPAAKPKKPATKLKQPAAKKAKK